MSDELTIERAAFLAARRVGRRETRVALLVVLISTIIFVAAVPFAKTPLERVPAFIPIYVSALVSCDMITAILLFSQFSVLRSPALLAVSSGYFFTASMTTLYTIIFPGLFSPTGLLGAGPQTTSAMYMFWHAGFPLFIIGYSLLNRWETEATERSNHRWTNPSVAILCSITVVLAVTIGFTLFVTTWDEHVPVFLRGNQTTDLGRMVLVGIWILSFLALLMLWRQRRYTVIDLWLMVVMCVWVFDIALAAVLNTGRYDLGWYTGRIYGLLAASLLLVLLLIENSSNYTVLVRLSAGLKDANKFLEQQARQIADDLQRYRGLLEAAPDAMVVMNQAGNIVLVNVRAERLFGFSRDALLGQQVSTILPEGFNEQMVADAIPATAAAPEPQIGTEIELSARRQDGSEFPIEITLSPLTAAGGVLVTAAIRDISARKKAEREALAMAVQVAEARDAAVQANRAKSRFLAGISHELRTPLNGIIGYAQLLKLEGGLSIVQSKRVGAMLGAGAHLLEMINCVLDLSQIEAGRLETQAVELDPRAIAEACLDLVRPSAETKQLALRFIADPAVPGHLMADATRLRQVLFNLLGNAVKFTARGSVALRLRTTEDGARLRLEVVDTGPGIPPERRQDLFHDFARLGAVDAVEGVGLGLALSARLATLMGGCLGYEDNPGGGSVFWLELPLSSRPAFVLGNCTEARPAEFAPPATAAAQPNKPATAHPLRILVVDYTAMNRDIARSFLRMAGHEVLLAEDGVGAVACAAAGNLDVVLMDIRMPNMSGLEATRRIRALPGPAGRVPIVALTAQVFAEQIETCRQAGMDGHLAKPFTQESLLAAVLSATTRVIAAEPSSDRATAL